MKLHINSQDLQSFIFTRLDLLKNVNSSEGGKGGKSKTGGETPVRTNLGEKTVQG